MGDEDFSRGAVTGAILIARPLLRNLKKDPISPAYSNIPAPKLPAASPAPTAVLPPVSPSSKSKTKPSAGKSSYSPASLHRLTTNPVKPARPLHVVIHEFRDLSVPDKRAHRRPKRIVQRLLEIHRVTETRLRL